MRRGLITLFCLMLAVFVPIRHEARAQMLTGFADNAQPVHTAAAVMRAPRPLLMPLVRPLSHPARLAPQLQMPPANTDGSNAPVDFEADHLTHDEDGQLIIASGHVKLKQSGRIVKADQIVYNTETDTVTAAGHVIFNDTSGDVHFADSVTLTNQMKDGFIKELQSYLAKGGKFTAKSGTRKDGTVITMNHASYTACDCDTSQSGKPAWQINAKKVVYDESEHSVTYHNADFDIYGVPVLWTPYFSHADGQIKSRSGFLTPVFGYNSDLGASVLQRYYWSMAPDHDATLGVRGMTGQSPMLTGEYRQRFDQASLKMTGSITDSSYTDQVGVNEVEKTDQLRGHIFANGLWDINDQWRSGVKVQLASDDSYLRQYDISGADVLENELYAERFSGRNYAAVRALAFQDVRVDEDKTDQPNILPEITANFVGEANRTLGGRWDASVSALGLTRLGNGQDVDRLSASTGWQRRMLTGFGDVTTVDVRVRGDAYKSDDKDIADQDPTRSDNGYATRLFPEAHVVTSYPLAKPMETMQAVIAPEVSLTAAPNINQKENNIPNEDSQDVQIDAGNVFNANRFPGYDRIEDASHAAYGVRAGLYGYGGSFGEAFLGQSHRFERDNPFPRGSGLSGRNSDVVGELNGAYDKIYGLNYRFELSSDNLASERHELDGYANWDRVQWNTHYFFDKALEDTSIVESRQQLNNMLTFKLTQAWSMRTGALYDLGQSPGLRNATLGIDYLGCCVYMALTAVRNFTIDSSGNNGTSVTFRVGLKGLGDFPQTAQQARPVLPNMQAEDKTY